MAYVLVLDNKGVEVARFHHTELRGPVADDARKVRDAINVARAQEEHYIDPQWAAS